MTDLSTLLDRSREIATRANDESWLHIYEIPPGLRDADREHIAEASPERWLALLDVAESAKDLLWILIDDPSYSVTRPQLHEALKRLATVMEDGSR